MPWSVVTRSCAQPQVSPYLALNPVWANQCRVSFSFTFTFISRARSRLLGDMTRRHSPLSLAPALRICFSPRFPPLLHLTPPRPILLRSTQHLFSRREGCLAELLFLDGSVLLYVQRRYIFSFVVSRLLSACCYSAIPSSHPSVLVKHTNSV